MPGYDVFTYRGFAETIEELQKGPAEDQLGAELAGFEVILVVPPTDVGEKGTAVVIPTPDVESGTKVEAIKAKFVV